MKAILGALLLTVSMSGFAWQTGTTVRTSDGDMIEAGNDVSKLSKLQNVKKAGSEVVNWNGGWVPANYYIYETYEANYRFTIIGRRIAKIEWER